MDTKLEESTNVIKKALHEGIIQRPVKGTTHFFMNKSRQSISVANRLYELEEEENLPASLWVINASYYSMFFAGTALLAMHNKRIKSETGIHRMTFHAIVHYFVNENNKFEKHIIESYKDAIEDAEELLQFSSSKAKEIVTSFDFEMNKRKTFTYNLGKEAERNKALTSLQRAKEFVKIIEEMHNPR